ASRTLAPYTRTMSGALQMLKCCLNPKVLAGLGAVAVAMALLAPNLTAGVSPLLLALVCPISMLVMMGGTARMGANPASRQNPQEGARIEVPQADIAVAPGTRLALLRAQQQLLAEQSAMIAEEIDALESGEAGAQVPPQCNKAAREAPWPYTPKQPRPGKTSKASGCVRAARAQGQ